MYNLQGKDDDYKSFHFSTFDNPHIPVDEIEKARKELTEDRFSQEYMADFRKTEGLVYKEFNRDTHIYDNKVFNTIDVSVGVDFGFTNPCAIYRIEQDSDNIFYITKEWYKTQKTTPEIIEIARSFNGNSYYPDPAEPDRIEEMRRAGLNVREVSKDIEAGINAVRELLKTNRLFIHSSCVNLINELETYSYPDKKPDRNENETPIKENDHACFTKDAILDFPIGSVIGQKSNGFKDVYEFRGSKVTADHPYLTQRGFVRLDALRYSDKIVIWKNKLWTELYLDDTQNQTGASLKTTLYLLQRNLQAIKQNASIDMYGRNIMVKYLRAFISIIKTVIHLTTIYLISNLYHNSNTLLNTFKNGKGSFKNGLKQVKMLLQYGLKHQKGKESEKNKEKQTQNTSQDIQLSGIAMNVIENTQLRQSLVNSATIIAKLKHLGKEEVFSTVSSSGFFTANGVVVSNCDAIRYVLYMKAKRMQQGGHAHTHYPSNTAMSHATPPSTQTRKTATTYIPRL